MITGTTGPIIGLMLFLLDCQEKKGYLIQYLNKQIMIQKPCVKTLDFSHVAGIGSRISRSTPGRVHWPLGWWREGVLSSDRTQLSGSALMKGDGRPHKRELLWLTLPALNAQRKTQGQKKDNQRVPY